MVRRVILIVFILGCIGMQARAFFVRWHHYPFVDYSMYCGARHAPVEAQRTYMFVVMPDGRRLAVPPAYMGLNWHAFWNDLAKPLSQLDDTSPGLVKKRPPAVERVVRQVQRVEGTPPVAIEFDIAQYRLDGGEILTAIEGVRINLPYIEKTRS